MIHAIECEFFDKIFAKVEIKWNGIALLLSSQKTDIELSLLQFASRS